MEFIDQHEDALPYHHPQWLNLLASVYDLNMRHVVSMDENQKINAILPAFQGKGLLGGVRMRAMPFSHFVPPLCTSASLTLALPHILEGHARQMGVGKIIINAPLPGLEASGWQKLAGRWESILDLRLLADKKIKIASSCLRNARKAVKSGITIERTTSAQAYKQFEKLMLLTRRRQGVPPYPQKLYPALRDINLFRLYMASINDQAVAAIGLLVWKDKVIYMYGGSSERGRDLRANDLLFHEVIESLASEGMSYLNFGVTPHWQPELLRFKNKWGCSSHSLDYSVKYLTATSAKNIDVRAGKLGKLAGSIINHMPLPLLQWSGNRFFKYLGWG